MSDPHGAPPPTPPDQRPFPWRAWLPFVLAAAGLAVATLVPRLPVPPLPPLAFQDKVVHAVAWAVLGATARVGAGRTRRAKARAVRVAWFLAMGYGVLIECLQLLVPGRSAEWLDLAADALGALVGAVVMDRWEERHGRGGAEAHGGATGH
ncbi:MAG: VanZ family protein [Myxococcota bacterium]